MLPMSLFLPETREAKETGSKHNILESACESENKQKLESAAYS